MSASEGILSYGAGRYKPIGRAGRDDHHPHSGDRLEIYFGGCWLPVWISLTASDGNLRIGKGVDRC